jgi:tripartite-type tricarboxylate transporter receptor subunit TctC
MRPHPRFLLALSVLLMAVAVARAQPAADAGDWPKRVIRFIITAPPGSAADTVARIVAQKLGDRIGQQLVLDNRTGASGAIGAEALAKAEPDGYTIGFATASTHVIARLANPRLPYDPVKDFAPVGLISQSPYALIVYPGLPVNNVSELVAYAKARPGQVGNATFGAGSLGNLAGALFAARAGLDLNNVPYRSSAQGVLDAVTGRIEMQFSSMPPAIPLIRDNRLRALATTGAKRSSALPDVPTLAEQGFPNFDVSLWMGIAMPAASPPAIIARLNAEMRTILQDRDVIAALADQGQEVDTGPPEHLGNLIKSDIDRWREAIASAGLKIE